MASSAWETGGGEGCEGMQGGDSVPDWMLDSSHVNVGLWNHFDGRRLAAREQGVHDLGETPQQSSSMNRLELRSQADVDLWRGRDGRRTFEVDEQGLGDRGVALPGRLDTSCGVPSDFAMNLSSNLNVRSRQEQGAVYVLFLNSY